MGTCISLPSLHRGKAGQKRGSVKSGFVGTGISKKKHEEINLEELKVGESAYNTGAYRGINRSVVNNARLSDSEDSEHRQPKNVYEQLHPQAACCSYRSNPGSVTSWVFESSGDTPKASYAPEIVPAEEHPLPETRIHRYGPNAGFCPGLIMRTMSAPTRSPVPYNGPRTFGVGNQVSVQGQDSGHSDSTWI